MTRSTVSASALSEARPRLGRAARALLRASTDARWAALVLFATAWAVYHPSFNRVFAADQIWYLAELNGNRSLGAGFAHLDYAVTRQYWKGDDLLFRPMLFSWLAIAHWLFGYHYIWWNVATVAIHATVAWALFRLYQTIAPSPLALPAATLFLVLEPSMELVIWDHLGGYLLACLFFAIGARAFILVTRQPDRWGPYCTYSLAFTAAALCYEAMVPTALVGAVLLIAHLWRRGGFTAARASVLLAPVVTFAVLYAFHVSRVEQPLFVGRAHGAERLEASNVVTAFPAAARSVAVWKRDLAMPTALSMRAPVFNRFVKSFNFSFREPLQALNALLVVMGLTLFVVLLSQTRLRENFPLIVMLVTAIGAHVFLISFGRAAEEVTGVTYYVYIFAVLAGPLLYAAVDLNAQSRWTVWAAVGVTCAFAALHAVGTIATARDIGRANRYPSLYLARVIRFVDEHRSEPGFSFAIEPHSEILDPPILLAIGYGNGPRGNRSARLTEIMFAAYYDARNPKYLLNGSAERFVRR